MKIGPIGIRIACFVCAYTICSVAAANIFFHYIRAVGGINNIPYSIIVVFGPFVALGQGHLALLFFAATLFCLPLVIHGLSQPKISFKSIWFAIGIWLLIGFWMT
jgi:hypothetical protein